MDVQMPDMDGLEATRRIVADPSITGVVVVVTTFDRDDYLFRRCTRARAASSSRTRPGGARHAVRVAAAGDALLSPAVTRRVIERFAASPTTPTTGPAAAPSSATSSAVAAPRGRGADRAHRARG
jgi:DNA-binding NarL/FixJ family response regulator